MEDENELTYTSKNSSPVNTDKKSNSLIYTPKNKKIHSTTAAGITIHGYNLGIGNSKYDKGLIWGKDINENDVQGSINEYRSQQQGLIPTVAAGLGRVGSKVSRELLKTAGAIVGTVGAIGGAVDDAFITGEDNHDFLKTAFDNDFIRATDKAFDNVNKEYLPVYVSDTVTNGGFFDKISNPEFWATEGADGVGYLLAAMAPGAAVKAMGVGESLFGGLTKLTSLKYGKSLQAAKDVLTAAGVTAGKIDNLIIPAVNTYFEAGAEAKGVGDDMDQRKSEFVDKRVSEIKNELLKSYNPNEPEFLQSPMQIVRNLDGTQSMHSAGLVPNPKYKDIDKIASEQAESEYKAQKGYAMRNTFLTNLAILAGPNYIQSKLIYGKNGAVNLLKKVSDKSVKRTLGKAAERMGEAFLSEGSEEVAQTSTEHRQTNKGLRGELHGGIDSYKDLAPGEFATDFIKTLGTTEGLVAGFLGGFLGSPISIVSGYRQDNRDRIKSDKLRTKIETAGVSLNDINLPVYKTTIEKNPDTGEDVEVFERDENNNKVPILENVNKIKNALNLHEKLSKIYDDAVEKGDVETVDELKKIGEHNLIMNFIGEDEMTIDALKEHLKLSLPTDTENKQENNNNTKRQTELIEKAKYLQKELVSFGDMSTSIIRLENENATPAQIKDFMKKLSDEFLNETSRLCDQRAKLKTLKSEKAHLESQTSILEIDNPLYQEGLSNELDKKVKVRENPRLDLKNSEIQKIEKEIKDSESFLNYGIWNSKIVNGAFNQELKQLEEIKSKVSPEKIAEITKHLEDVDNATSTEELDAIKSDNTEVNKKIESKRAELETLRKQKEASTAANNLQAKNDQEDLSKDIDEEASTIANNYKVGDTIAEGIHQGKKVESIEGDSLKLSIIEDDGNGGFVKSIETLPLPQQPATTSSTQTPEPTPLVDTEVKAANSGDLQMPHTNTDNKNFVDYMMTPINKIGNAVNFLLNFKNLKGNSKQAVDAYNAVLSNKPTNQADIIKTKELLFKWLPITAGFNSDPSITSWTEYPGDRNNYSYVDADGSPKFNFRRAIVDLIVDNGFSLEQINSTISGQMSGSFNNIKGAVNNVMDLYHVKVELKGNTKGMVMYHVNDENELVHVTDNEESKYDVELINKIKENNRGKILLSIRNLAGKMVPLFLNDKKLDAVRADVLADILIFVNEKIAEDPQSNIGSLILSSIKDQFDGVTYENIVLKLAEEIKLLGGENKVTLKQLVNILVYTKTNKQGVGENLDIVRTLSDGTVVTKIGNNSYVSSNIRENKDSIVNDLKKLKHNIITVENSQQFITPGINFKNQDYLEYIFKNQILNTDIDTREGHYNFKNETIRENGKVTQTGGELFVKSPVISDVKNNLKIIKNFENNNIQTNTIVNNIVITKNKDKFILEIFDGINGKIDNLNDRKNKDKLSITIRNEKGEQVGLITFWKDVDGKFFSNNSFVKEEYRKKGLASSVYDYVKKLGIEIKPSKIQTESGKALWKKLNEKNTTFTTIADKSKSELKTYYNDLYKEIIDPENVDGYVTGQFKIIDENTGEIVLAEPETFKFTKEGIDLYGTILPWTTINSIVSDSYNEYIKNNLENNNVDFDNQIQKINKVVEEIVNRNEKVKEFKPITKEDKNNIVNFDNLFSKISDSLNGKISDSKKESHTLLKSLLKEVHPDKFQNENQKLIAEIFTSAMIIVSKKGDVLKVQELYELFKSEIKNNSENVRNSENNVVPLQPTVILESEKVGTIENQELVKAQNKVNNETTDVDLSQQIIEQITDEVNILEKAKEALSKNNNKRNQSRVKASEKNIENFKKNYPNEFTKVNPKNC